VADYSRLTGREEEGTHARLQDHLRSFIDPKIAEHRGRVVKNNGDGLLAEFASVIETVGALAGNPCETERGPKKSRATGMNAPRKLATIMAAGIGNSSAMAGEKE